MQRTQTEPLPQYTKLFSVHNSEGKKMKIKAIITRTVCAALIASMVFGGTACGKKNNDEDNKPSENSSYSQQSSEQSSTSSAKGNINPLTGNYGLASSAVGKRPIAVVVENAPAARPQWGLSTPDVLIEGLVEGGYTRMLLLYSDVDSIPKVGPIRSARHDFVELSECFDSIYVHCGWSTYAKAKIESDKVNNLNGIQGYAKQFFYRDSSRKSKGTEHTGYSKGEYIDATIGSLKYRTDVKDAYKSVLHFNDPETAVKPAGGSCTSVSFMYSTVNKHVMTYDSSKGIYFDALNGSARKDADGVHLNYKNILVLYCDVKSMGDSKGCIDMALEKSNTGYYISDGGYEQVSWTKTGSASSSKLVINNMSGSAVSLNAGNTYIALVPSSQKSATSIA